MRYWNRVGARALLGLALAAGLAGRGYAQTPGYERGAPPAAGSSGIVSTTPGPDAGGLTREQMRNAKPMPLPSIPGPGSDPNAAGASPGSGGRAVSPGSDR